MEKRLGKKVEYARLETDTAATGSLTLEWAQMLRAWQNGQEAHDSKMPGQWRAGVKCEAKKWGHYIKPEVRTVEPLVPMGQIDIYSLTRKNLRKKKKGISFSKETKKPLDESERGE